MKKTMVPSVPYSFLTRSLHPLRQEVVARTWFRGLTEAQLPPPAQLLLPPSPSPGVAHPPSFLLPPARLLLPPPHSGACSSRRCRLGLRELPPASSPPRERELPPASSSPGGFLRRARGALHPRRCHPPPGAPSTPGAAPAASLGLIPFSVPADGQQSFGSAHRQPQRAAASALLHVSGPVPSRLCCAGA